MSGARIPRAKKILADPAFVIEWRHAISTEQKGRMALPVTTGASDFELATIFTAVVCLVAAAHALGLLFQRCYMPRVIGEIAGGLLLGPSLMGHLAPDLYRSLFAAFPTEGKLIWLLYWIGLVLLMFVSGFEVQRSVDRADWRIITAILIGATVLSFAAGVAAPAFYDFSPFAGPKANASSSAMLPALSSGRRNTRSGRCSTTRRPSRCQLPNSPAQMPSRPPTPSVPP